MGAAPTPHRGHPYWQGALADLDRRDGALPKDITSAPARRSALAIFAGLAARLVGRPPNVRPFHTHWLDYRTVRVWLKDIAAGKPRRLLYVRNESHAVDELMAALPCPVDTLRIASILEERPPAERAWDACFVCLKRASLARFSAILTGVAQRLAPGARLVIFVDGLEDAAVGADIRPEFTAAYPHGLGEAVAIQHFAMVGGSTRIAIGHQLARNAGLLVRFGPLLPWVPLRIAYLLLKALAANLVGAALLGRRHPRFSTSLLVELKGNWSHPRWSAGDPPPGDAPSAGQWARR
jgi:hypothetical protein